MANTKNDVAQQATRWFLTELGLRYDQLRGRQPFRPTDSQWQQVTHWHSDHFGGLAALAPQIPIREFIDHGPNEDRNAAAATDDFIRNVYPQLYAKAKHTVARPGDRISEVFVHAVHPRVAIMNNGTRKGGDPETMKTLHLSPGLEDLWQVHFSQLSGQEYTVPGMFIANMVDEPQQTIPIAPAPATGAAATPAPVHNGQAYWIKVSARKDGSFSATNARNQFTKTYSRSK